jgi:CRISPR-associated protein Cmr3
MTTYSLWVIEPHDTLVIRDGRPFSPINGLAQAFSLPFVPPSVVAGAVRQRVGSDANGVFVADKSAQDQLKTLPVVGPFLVEKTGTSIRAFFPRPADSLLLQGSNNWHYLSPNVYQDVVTNMPDTGLLPLYPGDSVTPTLRRNKARQDGAFWSHDTMLSWLRQQPTVPYSSVMQIDGLPRDTRVHVKMDRHRGTAERGGLFATQGLTWHTGGISKNKQYALALFVPSQHDAHMQRLTVSTLGGEQRLVGWKKESTSVTPALLQGCPDEIMQGVLQARRCRVVTATPAYFEQGWLPQRLLQPVPGIEVQPRLIAVGNDRAEFYSGWDMQTRAPKHSRKFIPAGSVFFVDFADVAPTMIERWVHHWWMQPISDTAQDVRDGFGVAFIGTWNK